jgi:site-specific DNA-methyltransferase (adenine-specific)
MRGVTLNRLLHGDCLDVLRTLDDCSVDAVVTDPPAGIAFMGKAWDGNRGGRDQWVAWLAERLEQCLRVLKPGGHAVVWALPRTSGWTHRALEDAGFEVRDCITHLFGMV